MIKHEQATKIGIDKGKMRRYRQDMIKKTEAQLAILM